MSTGFTFCDLFLEHLWNFTIKYILTGLKVQMKTLVYLFLIVLSFFFKNNDCFSQKAKTYLFDKYDIRDTCEMKGYIKISLFRAGKDTGLLRLNRMVINKFVNFLNETNDYTLEKFTTKKDCIDGHLWVHVNYKFPVASFYMDYEPIHKFYYNKITFSLDIQSREETAITDIINKKEYAKFEEYVKKFAKYYKVDNVYKTLDIEKTNEDFVKTHKKSKIKYLRGIDPYRFYISGENIVVVYTN